MKVLNRHKKKLDLPLSFIHNNRELTIPIDIANAFNSYFAAIGRNIAAALDSDYIKDQTYSTYLNTPHRSQWQFKCVSEFEIIIAINNLENKSSTGCDGISNKLLKYIKDVVTKPLTGRRGFISHEMESGNTPGNIYVDLSKAFDTINYDILLDKLSYYGISGTALKLSKNYLLDRKQYVVYNNCNSNLVDVTTGVPQGSILGPLLFSIFINDLIHVTDKLKFIMYADDTTIYFSLEDFDPATRERDINSELEKINIWLKLNKLSLNVKKKICNL